MSPGAAVLKLRKVFGHGLRVAYFRDVVRPRILRTPPITDTVDRRCEIHVLTSAGDWLNLVWTLKSFYWSSGRRFALCIHDDGSLGREARLALRRHFPQARLVDRDAADARVLGLLAPFPRCQAFRSTNLLAPKLFDFNAYLEGDRLAVFDSDLLFFSAPQAFLGRVDDQGYRLNTFNGDCGESKYTVEAGAVRARYGFDLVSAINSGFGLVHPQSLRLDWIEDFLAMPGLASGHFWRIEQTLFAMCSSRHGAELLPSEYTLDLRPDAPAGPFRHYVGAIRHLMYAEGMARLVRLGLLRDQSLQGGGRACPAPAPR